MYSARINGQPTTFGTSGLLYRSNKVMYDRQTNTLWSQFLGAPIIGPLVGSGIRLELLPVALTTWGEWVAEHPETTVLSLETGYYAPSFYQPEDDMGSFYFEYRADPETMFPIWQRDDRLNVKAEVLGLSVEGVSKAYPISALQRLGVLHDTVNGLDVVIVASPGSSDARAYESGGLRFSLPEGASGRLPGELVDADGVAWAVTGDALVSSADPSQRLRAIPSHVSFWFGWFAFRPDTLVFGE